MKTQLLIASMAASLFLGLFAQGQIKKEDLNKVTDTINGKVVEILEYPEGSYNDFKATIQAEIDLLNDEHNLYASEQKTLLKEYIEQVNIALEKGKYSADKGQEYKEKFAEQIATRIAASRTKTDAAIAFAKVRGTVVSNASTIEVSTKNGIKLDIKQNHKRKQKEIKTHSGFTIGFAYNFMNGEDLGINDFSYPNNNYFSLGYQWKTRLDAKNNFRLLYGVEYQSHGTELNGNRFITQGDQAQIADLGFATEKAKFRQDQLVFPFHLEFGGSKRKEYEDGRIRFQEYDEWKFGIGGFAGFNMSSRLKLKYDLDGREIKETRINNFDNEVFLYGADAYVGKGNLTFFGRMNFNNVFKNNSVNAQYVTFGIRIQD